ncbi:alpha/beta hydrolase [Phreatobacter stygius]|uniref:Alpha/beta hydrolase n=1 Tax=Phreatobacter stygius TaxID=1940610 RepID=A0A4D7BAQ4_9HYPH|nr:alpha/beta hydrolase [Phreatobacter stygius]QCI66566.1 alpha/beta hydrolase [Phreatobacter stygius]
MSSPDLEIEYNNRARVADHPAVMHVWARDAAAYREASPAARLDQPYGAGARHRYDLFPAAAARHEAPLLLFIHGGYWQALDKTWFSQMARGANGHGLDVAVMSYDLCPAVTVAEIVGQVIACTRVLRERFGRRILPFGHSAGGHLAACLGATDWLSLGEPADLIAGILPISGLFHLAPLVPTSLNTALGLDAAAAARLSPLTWTPRRGLPVTTVVGGDEAPEYLRQSRSLIECWGVLGATTRAIEVAGANHFTVVLPFADPASELTRELAMLAG